jgi:molybdate transport system substrate-binding protein
MSSTSARAVSLLAVPVAVLMSGMLWLSAGQPAMAQVQRNVTVFAAASLTTALKDIVDAFTADTKTRVKLSFAASSTLARQIESGASADLFISADEAWMDYLEQRGLIDRESRKPLVGNRLVLVVPADRPLQLEIGPDRGWLQRLPAGRIATGDPTHVPVGRYAEQALKKLGVWTEIAPRLARADNVRNALVLVERGEAAAGIVYETDAKVSPRVAVAATVPESAHEPISYPVALVAGRGQAEARSLYSFLFRPEARSIFLKHGFTAR